MQGVEKPDRELLDVLGLCGGLVREGSVYRFLAENRLRLGSLHRWMRQIGHDGRLFQSASEPVEVLSMAQRLSFDERARIEAMRAEGLSVDDTARRLGRHRSTVYRELGRNGGGYDAQAAELELVHDYDGGAKPWCDWSDPDERAWLVDELVTDACAVLDAVEGLDLTDEQADAVGLLGTVAGQDVEADPNVAGRWRIARRVAAGRVISVVDPEARHAHKTRSVRRDGYKAHIVAEPDTGIVTATELTAADASDAKVGARLLDTDPTCHTDTDHTDTAGGWLVLADSAYASGEALGSFTDAGWDTAIKPIERRPLTAGGLTRDDFDIDTDAQAVTCPAGHTRPVTSGAARFGRLCAACPLRARCTTSQRGRSVTVDAHEPHRRANKDRWRNPGTQAAYRRHRPMAERTIAWLTRGKARRVPYRGVAANNQWLTHRAAAINLVRLTNLASPTTAPDSPCPPADPHTAPRPHPGTPAPAAQPSPSHQPHHHTNTDNPPATTLLNSLLGGAAEATGHGVEAHRT